MNIKKLKILAVFIAFAASFLLHFLYKWIPCFVTSIFSPINESITEHMKIIFGSIIISGIVQKIIMLIKKEKNNSICFSTFISAISAIPIFLIMYLPIYNLFGEYMIVTLIILFITIVFAQVISYFLMIKKEFKLENVTIYFVIVVYIIFTLITYM